MPIKNKLNISIVCPKCSVIVNADACFDMHDHYLICKECGHKFAVTLDSRCSIESFRKEYGFLSNFYPCRIEYKGLVYGSVEAAFQAQKCDAPEESAKFQYYDAKTAKREGRRVDLRPDWDKVKDEILFNLISIKFVSNPALRSKLLTTGEANIVEGNNWCDNYYGDCRCGKCLQIRGKNLLGQILMDIRNKINNGGKEMNEVNWCSCSGYNSKDFRKLADFYASHFIPTRWYLEYGTLHECEEKERTLYITGKCNTCGGFMRSGTSIPINLTGESLVEAIYNQFNNYQPHASFHNGAYHGALPERTNWYLNEIGSSLEKRLAKFVSLFRPDDQVFVSSWVYALPVDARTLVNRANILGCGNDIMIQEIQLNSGSESGKATVQFPEFEAEISFEGENEDEMFTSLTDAINKKLMDCAHEFFDKLLVPMSSPQS